MDGEQTGTVAVSRDGLDVQLTRRSRGFLGKVTRRHMGGMHDYMWAT